MTLNLTHLLENACQHQPDEICATVLGDDETILTYRQASASLSQHAVWLKQEITPDRNDVVIAYLASNSVDFILSVLAGSSVALPALLNTRWTASEMAKALHSKGTSAVTFLLYGPEFSERAHELAQHMTHIIILLPIPSFALQHMQSSIARKNEVTTRRNDLALPVEEFHAANSHYSRKDAVIVFTSGTSGGRPKGVRLSHRAIAVQCWAKCQLPCGYSRNTKMLASTVPFFHIGGLSSLLAVWMTGGRIVLSETTEHHATGFNPEMVWRAITPSLSDHAARANTLVVVPAMLFILQQHPRNMTRQPNHSVQLVLVGGQSITRSQKAFLRESFPSARVVQTYACTEAASSLTFHPVPLDKDAEHESSSHLDITGSDCVGSPPDHIEICLLDKDLWTDQGKIQITSRPWRTGIIATRGPHLMNGYWTRGHETPYDRVPDQFFVTNDLAYWDDKGQLYFSGRMNDSIRTGGETVMSSEVERVLLLHPHINDCAVFPIPDSKFGESVACAVVASQRDLTLQQIRQWCQENGLSNYKHPHHLFKMTDLPKNATGKTLKFRLIEQFSPKPRSKL